jgi:MFS family permease
VNVDVKQTFSARRRLLFLYFFTFAVGGASWLVRLPGVRTELNISVAVLGWVLFAGAVGAMSSLLAAGLFVARFGARKAVILGFTLLGVGQLIQALSLIFLFVPGVAVGGLVAGLGYGIGDVGINVDGADLEKSSHRSLLPQLHGAYSLGALLGAGLGTLLIAMHFPISWQMMIIATATTAIAWATYRMLPDATGKATETPVPSETEKQMPRKIPAPSRRILFLGFGIMGLSLAEGGANDWLALSFVDGYSADAVTAGVGFAVLTCFMVITRFVGGRIVDRFGRVLALRVTIGLGVVGVVLVMSGVNVALAMLGAALWGIGVALGFPLFISAASDGPSGSRDVSTVTSFGYAAFLAGPPTLGFLGQALGLLPMFGLLALALLAALWFAGAAKSLDSSARAH